MQTERRGLDLLTLAVAALRLSGPTKPAPIKVAPANHRYVTMEEVSWHDNAKDCWVVIYDRVYDITHFLDEHPCGSEVLLEYAGRDATLAFRGAGHSAVAVKTLQRFLVAELPPHECIFRSPTGIRLSGIPT